MNRIGSACGCSSSSPAPTSAPAPAKSAAAAPSIVSPVPTIAPAQLAPATSPAASRWCGCWIRRAFWLLVAVLVAVVAYRQVRK